MKKRKLRYSNASYILTFSWIPNAQGGCFRFMLFQTQVEPIIQAGHEGVVHHMLLYECSDHFPEHHLNYTGSCYASNMPPAVEECTGVTSIAAWAIGGDVSEVGHTAAAE